MKPHNYIIAFIILVFAFLFVSCEEEGRIDQIDQTVPAPQQAAVRSVTPRPGGAVIHYDIPDDDNIIGVKAVYERNGETCESMASRFVDSLKVEGFGDTSTRQGTLYSVGTNGLLSEGVPFTVTPEMPPVLTAKYDLEATFGGVAVRLADNPSNADLSVVLLVDTLLTDSGKAAKDIDWEELYTFHTSSSRIVLTRRGLESETRLYGVYLRDRWNNTSEIMYKEITPLEEIKLPTSTWTNAALPTDEYQSWQNDPNFDLWHLWDGNYHDWVWASTWGHKIRWITISLGYTAIVNRFILYHRYSEEYASAAERRIQLWGSMDPNMDGSWDDSWYLLGDFEHFKPSGYNDDGTVGTITDEDLDYWRNRNEHEMEYTDEVENPYREFRYLRIKFLGTYANYLDEEANSPNGTMYVVGELVMYGQMPNQEEKDKYYNP